MSGFLSTLVMAFVLLGFPFQGGRALAASERSIVSCANVLQGDESFDSRKSATLQAVRVELQKIQNFFVENKNLSGEERVSVILEHDIRRSFFRLQALSKMLADQSPQFFSKQRSFFKSIEDSIGKAALAQSLREAAEKIKEPQLVDFFKKQEVSAKEAMVVQLNEAGLLDQPESVIKKMNKGFAKKGHWEVGKSERKLLVLLLQDSAIRLHQDVKNNLFDNSDIELGLHELRRRLRWILLQVDALKGVVEIRNNRKVSKEVQIWFDELRRKKPDILKVKYLNMDPAKVEKAVRVPSYEMAIINSLVEKIGDSKDSAEVQIYFKEALDHLKAPEKMAGVHAKLSVLLETETIDHQAMAREIQSKLAKTKLLKSFGKSLEAMN